MSTDNQQPATINRSSRRLKVLVSAYSCEPDRGSEPAVGWSTVVQMSQYHDLCVVTRSNNKPVIDHFLAAHPDIHIDFKYYDLPRWLLKFKAKGTGGVQWYYPVWQLGVYPFFRSLAKDRQFDLAVHLTMGKYYIPSLLPLLKIPFLWGVVGAGESMPLDFFRDLSGKELVYEFGRCLVRRMNELNPLLWLNARRASMVLAASEQSATRIRRLGARNVRVLGQHAITIEEYDKLAVIPSKSSGVFRFISIGRATGWKGFHLGLKAFSKSGLKNAEYWLLVNGGSRPHLEKLARTLGISNQVRFLEKQQSLDAVYNILGQCDVLVHPALHEAFGAVVLEARAAGRPVLCFDLGGPAMQVDGKNGIKVPAGSRNQAVEGMATAMQKICNNRDLYCQMAAYAKKEARETGVWDRQSGILNQYYLEASK